MAQTKYVVFKSEDATTYLTPEQKQNLLDILNAINTGRRQQNKSIGDLFFVLNAKDTFALSALDSYIAAIQQDNSLLTNTAVQAALHTAVDVRQTASLNVISRLPD